jgi:Na+-transporting methylmalonyl-CoA/oxaloacetate decarboxylase gamma subunit
MLRYILIEAGVLSFLIAFVALMCQVAKRFVWPGEPLHPSFVGSLLSASGTIFAASIAWAIADHSIEYQKANAADQARERVIADQKRERELIDSATEFGRIIDKFLARFPPTFSVAEFPEALKFADLPRAPLILQMPASSLITQINEVEFELGSLQQQVSGQLISVPDRDEKIAASIAKLRVLHQRLMDDAKDRLRKLNS